MPRSTTRANSIAPASGGPASKSGEAIGISSVLVVRTPRSGVSGKGVPTSILIPASTSVFPSFTLADPCALSMQLVSI